MSDRNQVFVDLLENTYHCMVGVREALSRDNQQEYNIAMNKMQTALKDVYLYSERYRYIETKKAACAKKIIDDYNKFVEVFNKFSAYPFSARMTSEAQQYGKKTDALFNELQDFVIKSLSEFEE